MILLVCGGRKYDDKARLYDILDTLHRQTPVRAIVHGDASGADRMAGNWAHERGLPEVKVPANWTFYDGAAGATRNQWMLDIVTPDVVLAVRGEDGTADMVQRAKQKPGVRVIDLRMAT